LKRRRLEGSSGKWTEGRGWSRNWTGHAGQLAGRKVRIPAAADVEERRLRDLSGDIKLKPGELRIEFFGAEDLAAKLLELSKAMSNDWPAFARAVESGGQKAAASVR